MADYEAVLKGKYPAKAHAKKVVDYLKKGNADINGILYLEGQKTRMIEDNDGEAHFRQRRYFYYLTGCSLPDASLAYDISTSKSTLFIPPIDADSVIWSGLPLSPEEALSLYDVDEVLTSDKLSSLLSSHSTVHAIADQVSPNTISSNSKTNLDLLKTAIEDCRATKDAYEIALTRKANVISTIGHTAVMKAVKKAKTENELYALFLQKSIVNGAPEQAYHSIFASGTAAATLHYVKNDEPLEGKLNLLVDAGAEFDCYASDITRTFPINGKFTKESREIYDLVLKMQEETTNTLKEGILWDEVHLHAHRIAIDGLLELGILKGNKEEILKARTSVAFFPHGLGHYLGMDTHDTGGKPNYSDPDPMFRYLRARVHLPAGVIITVEPGIYFCKFIIDPYLKDPKHAKYIDEEVLKRYWTVGGVRIEDNILITKDGFENLTTTPKSVEDMERLINGA